MSDLFHPVFHDRSDPKNVHVSCTCGEWEFKGDWDDMCASWSAHETDPEAKYLYFTKPDHKPTALLTRAGSAKLEEILNKKKGKNDEIQNL